MSTTDGPDGSSAGDGPGPSNRPAWSDDPGQLAELVAVGDLAGLAQAVDGLVEAKAWDELVDLGRTCRAEAERGRRPLLAVASRAEYRLALDAPAPHAARVLRPGAGPMAPGPLPEVVASRRSWAELEPHVEPGADATYTAHERVVRGEDLRHAHRIDDHLLDLPRVLQPWEGPYAVATYRPDGVDTPPPALPRPRPVELPEPVREVGDLAGTEALADLAATWVAESAGQVDAIAVAGDVLGALATFGLVEASLTELALGEATAAMAWTAASGGVHGRRRGMAAGRYAAWWVLAALTERADEWPVDPDDLGEAASDLRWFLWDAGPPVPGYALTLGVEDPAAGVAWLLAARDPLD